MFRGDVCFSTMSSLPSRTRLLGPSVRKTTFAGTWSDSPRRLAAYAPVGCSRVAALPANALATLSTLGAVTPTMGWRRGTSYSPRATRRIVPVAAIRESALSTASREPRSRKSGGEKTQPFSRAFMRTSIVRSIGFATFIRNLLSEICMRFSDKRQPHSIQNMAPHLIQPQRFQDLFPAKDFITELRQKRAAATTACSASTAAESAPQSRAATQSLHRSEISATPLRKLTWRRGTQKSATDGVPTPEGTSLLRHSHRD